MFFFLFSSESNFEHRLNVTNKIGKNKKGTGNYIIIIAALLGACGQSYEGSKRISREQRREAARYDYDRYYGDY